MQVHFLAVGGSVMHQLAVALLKKGYKGTGSDGEIFEPAKSNLEKAGILPQEAGWRPEGFTISWLVGAMAKQALRPWSCM